MPSDPRPRPIRVRVIRGGRVTTLEASHGAILRRVLLENELSPYSETNRILNCHGLGICGTCQVIQTEGGVRERKRSCQIRCFRDLEIEL